MSKVAKAFRTGVRSITGRDKAKEAEKKAKEAAREAEASEKRQLELTNQATNKARQESSDLLALADQSDNDEGMAGILTSVEGLVPGDRRLGKKKALGG